MEPSKAENIRKYLTICIEYRCNNNCLNCMIRNIKNAKKSVPLHRYKISLEENLKSGKYESLILSGAEATLNEQLIQYVEYARHLGVLKHIRIQTNGRRLSDKKYCRSLIAAGVDEFFISLYGSNQNVHESLTQSPDSFAELMQGIKNVGNLGGKIIFNTVVTRLNYTDLGNLVSLTSSFFGIDHMQFWNYFPMSTKDQYDLLVENSEAQPYLNQALGLGKQKKIPMVLKNFPECLLGEYTYQLDNSLSDCIVDQQYWEEYDTNRFGQCIHKEDCESQKCQGLSQAYIEKFGQDENILKPIKLNKSVPDSFSPSGQQFLKYLTHRQKFSIKENIHLKLFEELLLRNHAYELECSCKVEKEIIYPARFNLWFTNHQHEKNLQSILAFIEKVSELNKIEFSFDLFNKIYTQNIDLTRVCQLIAGIDYREKLQNSRIKIWSIIKDYPKMMDYVFSLSGSKAELESLCVNDELLFGLDFSFNGSSKLKTYLLVDEKQLKDPGIQKKMARHFSEKVQSLMFSSDRVHISVKPEHNNRVLHFLLKDYDPFIKRLKHKNMEYTTDKIVRGTKLPHIILSLDEKEIETEIRRFNVYY